MAVSTEVRSPFLDFRIVEFAAKLPLKALMKGGKGKKLLRRLGQERLPPRVLSGGKRGFGVPVGEWIRGPEGADLVRDRLTGSAAAAQGLWDSRGVAEVLQAHLDQKRNYGEHLWRLLILESWLRKNAAGARA
jgi:asparagine synthase (glutamine-hydrolysing)